IEREYPLRVEAYEISRGTGGKGKTSGADGILRHLTLTHGSATVVAGTYRVTTKPWGLQGGEPGSNAQIQKHTYEETTTLPAMSKFDVEAGHGVSIQTAGGGGYGSTH